MFAVIDAGVPDGFRIDIGGNLWTSCATGVQCFDPSGTMLGEILVLEFGARSGVEPVFRRAEDRSSANHRHNVGLHDLCGGNWLLRGLPVCCEESPQGLEEQAVPVSQKKISRANLPAPLPRTPCLPIPKPAHGHAGQVGL